MAIHTEGRRTGEHVLSEANGSRSREQGVLAAGNLPAGTVLALDADGNYVQLAPTAANTTKNAVAVLYAAADASAAPVPCVVHARDCEVIGAQLEWPAGITDPQTATATTNLAAAGIIIR